MTLLITNLLSPLSLQVSKSLSWPPASRIAEDPKPSGRPYAEAHEIANSQPTAPNPNPLTRNPKPQHPKPQDPKPQPHTPETPNPN